MTNWARISKPSFLCIVSEKGLSILKTFDFLSQIADNTCDMICKVKRHKHRAFILTNSFNIVDIDTAQKKTYIE